jgi:hypothetical protein
MIYNVIGVVGYEFGLIYLTHNSSCSQKNEQIIESRLLQHLICMIKILYPKKVLIYSEFSTGIPPLQPNSKAKTYRIHALMFYGALPKDELSEITSLIMLYAY